jgi:hypothetical protein
MVWARVTEAEPEEQPPVCPGLQEEAAAPETTTTTQETYETLISKRGATRARRFYGFEAKSRCYRESRRVRFNRRHAPVAY